MIERRTATGGVEAADGKMTGLVTPFMTWTKIGSGQVRANGAFNERIGPGAFSKTLSERDAVFLWNHNTDMPLARSSVSDGPGSLSLNPVEGDGLRAVADPVDTSYGRDLRALAAAKVVRGMSFGFEVIKDEWTDAEGRAADQYSGTHRTITEVRLHEVSAVTFPAYETTTFSARDAYFAGAERTKPEAKERDGGKKKADKRAAEIRLKKSTKRRLPQIISELTLACDAFAACKNLPDELKDAVNLVNSASTHARHIAGAEKGVPDVSPAKTRTSEPVATTPEENDDAEYRAWVSNALTEYLRTR